MLNQKYLRNTSKMLSFNRNGKHHHDNTLKGLSFASHILIETHPFRVGIDRLENVFLLKGNHFVIFIRNYLKNTSKMLSFNRKREQHHNNTLKGLSFAINVLTKTHPFRVGINRLENVFLLKDNPFRIFLRKYLRNTSKMLSFNRNGNHHHDITLKGLSFNVLRD